VGRNNQHQLPPTANGSRPAFEIPIPHRQCPLPPLWTTSTARTWARVSICRRWATRNTTSSQTTPGCWTAHAAGRLVSGPKCFCYFCFAHRGPSLPARCAQSSSTHDATTSCRYCYHMDTTGRKRAPRNTDGAYLHDGRHRRLSWATRMRVAGRNQAHDGWGRRRMQQRSCVGTLAVPVHVLRP
jgi:hypothetical protein